VQKAEQRAKQLIRVGSGVLAATLIGSGIAGSWAWKTTEEAKAGTRIERAGAEAIRQFEIDQSDGLRSAMNAGFELQKWVGSKSIDRYPALSPILALQSGLERIRETKLLSNQGGFLSVAFSPDGSRIATGELDGTTKLWDKDGAQIGQFEGGGTVSISPDWQTIAIVQKPSYFDTPLPNSAPTIVNLYPIDLNLASLLRRACQRLKPYILSDPNQKTEQAQCEAQLGESWEGQRTSK
jgi:hypothetical protein